MAVHCLRRTLRCRRVGSAGPPGLRRRRPQHRGDFAMSSRGKSQSVSHPVSVMRVVSEMAVPRSSKLRPSPLFPAASNAAIQPTARSSSGQGHRVFTDPLDKAVVLAVGHDECIGGIGVLKRSKQHGRVIEQSIRSCGQYVGGFGDLPCKVDWPHHVGPSEPAVHGCPACLNPVHFPACRNERCCSRSSVRRRRKAARDL